MKSKYTKKEIKEFLRESNEIEGVYDEDSLEQALKAWKYLSVQKELNNNVILETHKILMINQGLQPHEIGYFRRVPVYIGGHEALRWENIEVRLDEWIKSVENTIKAAVLNPEEESEKRIKADHVEYETIHGFIDGNGRSGRLFYLWERMQIGLPIHIIKSEERGKYYEWFR